MKAFSIIVMRGEDPLRTGKSGKKKSNYSVLSIFLYSYTIDSNIYNMPEGKKMQ